VAHCQRWEQLLRWFIYHYNVGIWKVRVSLGWNHHGNFLMPPTMNLGGLHRIGGDGIHTLRIIDRCGRQSFHYHCRVTRNSCVGIVICANDKACHVVNEGSLSPQMFSFPWNQWLSGFIWILSIVNSYICRRIESFKCCIEYLVTSKQQGIAFIIPTREEINLLIHTMYRSRRHRKWLHRHNSLPRCWRERTW